MTESLHTKFGSLETQLSTQHSEIGAALTAIIAALGGVPPGPSTTLADISTQMSALNDDLQQIISDNRDYYASSLELLTAIAANTLTTANTLDLIYTNTESILTNNSLNAQRLIAAILSTACACDTTAPPLGLPIDVTPTSLVDEAKCRRIQYYLSIFGNWLTKIANYGSAAGFVTGDTLGTLLGLAASEAGLIATGAEVGAVGGPPGVVLGAIIGLIMGAIFTFGGSALVDYATQFNAPELRSAILMAMYAEDNASDGRAAFHTVLLANMATIPAEIIYTLFWAAWSNDIYSGVPVVDDSAFDGSICAPPVVGVLGITTCTTFTGTPIMLGSDLYYAIQSGTMGGPSNVYMMGDFFGYSYHMVSGTPGRATMFFTLEPGATAGTFRRFMGVPDSGSGIDSHTAGIAVCTADHDSDAFTFQIEFCPPA